MKRVFIAVISIAAIALLVQAVSGKREARQTDIADAREMEPLLTEDPIVPQREEDLSDAHQIWVPTVDDIKRTRLDPAFSIDSSRLYDLAYLNDPDLLAYARTQNFSAECIVAREKRRLDGVEVPKGVCAHAYTSMMVNPNKDDFEAFSDQELQSLAETDASAAVILGRRVNDRDRSEYWYEVAVALSGKPGPLEEWISGRDQGLTEAEYNALRYEVYLAAAAIGGYGIDALPTLEVELSEAGVPLEPIRQRANERLRRLTAMRMSLVGRGWRA